MRLSFIPRNLHINVWLYSLDFGQISYHSDGKIAQWIENNLQYLFSVFSVLPLRVSFWQPLLIYPDSSLPYCHLKYQMQTTVTNNEYAELKHIHALVDTTTVWMAVNNSGLNSLYSYILPSELAVALHTTPRHQHTASFNVWKIPASIRSQNACFKLASII